MMHDLSDTSIRSVEVTPLRFPLAKPISSALGAYPHIDATAVRVQTEGGVTGLGITAGLGGSARSAVAPYVEAELAPLAIGLDVLSPEAVANRLWSANKPRMRGGLGVWALSAVDIAVWDALAKSAGLPLHSVLGGHQRSVPVYGSGGWHSLSNAELISECQSFVELGIGAYKYKVGTDRDLERTSLLRREMGDDLVLLADANQRFTVSEAIEFSKMLADHDVAWLEEPVLADSTNDLEEVAARSAVPVAAGENVYFGWGFREICDRRAAAFLQPDVGRVGGVTHFMRVAHLADAHNLRLSSHLWHELSVTLVGAVRSGFMAEYTELLPPHVFTRPFDVSGGTIEVPDVPGHGVELADGVLDRFRN